jgi:hypothetical protein
MKKDVTPIMLPFCLLCICIAVAGCNVHIACCIPLAKYEKIVHLSEPMAEGSSFSARTHDGSIKVIGGDIADCNVTATIIARAGSYTQAEEIAERTKLSLERLESGLKVKVEKPLLICQSIDVQFDVKVPANCNLELITKDGDITVEDIKGIINVKTGDGTIAMSRVGDKIKARSFDGTIRIRENIGDISARSFDGRITVAYSEDAEGVCDVTLTTNDGTIDLRTPEDFSAAVEISTNDGSIHSDLPIEVAGKLSKKRIKGTIGTGRGRLYVKSGDGTIRIR